MKLKRLSLLLLATASLLLTTSALHAQQTKKAPPPLEAVPGSDAYFELHYVPKERLTGNPKWDHKMALHLFVPKEGKGPFPVIFLVHGGGYWEGDMDGGKGQLYPELAADLIKRGYAVANFNYILGPDILPQVYWDFRTAIRFLRANAAKYKLDTDRIGAIGFSAGGWLISSAAWTDANDFAAFNNNSTSISEFDKKSWTTKAKQNVILPMDDPNPAYPEFSSRITAVSFDFFHSAARISPDDPATNNWCGTDFTPAFIKERADSGVPFSLSVLTEDKYKGKGVHVPDLKSPALAADGKTPTTLANRIVEHFDQHILQNPRAVAPEVRPNPRLFAEKSEISFVVPPGYTVHYTTDGTDPTDKSPAYTAPFSITDTTTIKAFSTAPNRTSSGILTANYYKAPNHLPPVITSPDTVELKAKVGQPFSVTFIATGAGDKPLWFLSGQLFPHVPYKQKEVYYAANMKLDPATATVSGTPTEPGRYWLQIQVAPGERRLGTARNYILIVEP